MGVKLILTGHGYKIGKKGGMIVVSRADGGKKEVSVGNLSMIMVNSRGVSLSGDAIQLLLRHGVQLVFMSRNKPVGKLQPMWLRFPVALKKEQVKAQMDERGVKIAKAIVLNKVGNQIKLLKRLYKSRLRRRSRTSDDLNGYIKDATRIYSEIASAETKGMSRAWLISKEAEAARHYWDAISTILPEDLGFNGRKTRYENPDDPFNLSLNYMYSLLASQVWFSVEVSGLDPFIGYLHEDSNRRPSLVMDLMEEFRQPVVDKPLLAYFAKHNVEGVVDGDRRLREDFRKILLGIFFEELDRQATFMNRSIPIRGHMSLQPKRLARYILGLSPSYQPYNVV